MKTDGENYLIPIILGFPAEDGIDVNDQILEKLITPQLIKIKNTFYVHYLSSTDTNGD